MTDTQPPAADRDAYRSWTPAAQEKALQMLREQVGGRPWRPFWCPNPACDGQPHSEWSWPHARSDQRPPPGTDWAVWLMKSGRGSGKTRTGSEYTHRVVEKVPRIAIVGPTTGDIREIMLEGESGLLTIAKPGHKPVHEPSKRRLTWPNGAVGNLYSAEEPDRLRGPEHYFAWCDEPCHWPLVEAVWDNLQLGLRLGDHPHVVATTTPKTRPWLKTLQNDPTTRVSRASTFDNIANLSAMFIDRVVAKYEGTRLGQQELHGKELEDVEGALWTWDMIERGRVAGAPDLERIVVGVDPAGSANKRSDRTGILVVGIAGEHLYVLADRSGRYSPHGWASAANAAYEQFAADAIVAEKNYGGDMVRHTLLTSGYTGARVLVRHTRRSKALRAEPLVGRYEKTPGFVHHVGMLDELEEQMTTWQPYEDSDSPDNVDALVYAATELMRGRGMAAVATPTGRRLPPGWNGLVRGGAA